MRTSMWCFPVKHFMRKIPSGRQTPNKSFVVKKPFITTSPSKLTSTLSPIKLFCKSIPKVTSCFSVLQDVAKSENAIKNKIRFFFRLT